jgi:hypothetical protein
VFRGGEQGTGTARAGEKEPAIILLTGMGPVKTVQVDENGKPLPPGGRGKE